MLRWLLCGVGVVFSGASMASPTPSGAEYATLPPYCKEKGEHPDPVANQIWSDKFGSTWGHMHHYCFGLNYLINRYYTARTPQDRAWMLGEAVSNISYTLNAAKPGFILLPEMHLNRGKAYRLLGRGPEAVHDWFKAKTLNPEYVAAYIALADYYAEFKQQDKALEMVTEGLRHVPASKGLQRRYQELGGKLPFPEPYEKPVEQNAAAEIKAATDTATTDKSTPDSRETEAPKPAEKTTTETPSSVPVIVPAEPIAQPKNGTPNNPYCRFCTD